MKQVFVVTLTLAVICTHGLAGAEPHAYIHEAERHYQEGDFEKATRYLLAVPGMLQLSPRLTGMEKDDRARVFFDLGCAYLAAGDSVRADHAFKEAFSLNDKIQHGYFATADPGVFWWALLRNQEAARRMKTRRLFAAMRSAAIPGWGQIYRGHKKKGLAFLGAALATSGVIALKYREYKNARAHYVAIDPTLGYVDDETDMLIVTNNPDIGARKLLEHWRKEQRYLNEDGTQYTEWEARFRQVDNSARRVNVLLGVLSALWLLNVADSAVFGPAPMGQMGVSVSF